MVSTESRNIREIGKWVISGLLVVIGIASILKIGFFGYPNSTLQGGIAILIGIGIIVFD